jgi:predicted Zn-dependent protease
VSDRGLAAVEAYYAELSTKLAWNAAVPSQVVSEIALDMLQAGKTAEGFELLQRILRDDPNSPDGYDSLSEAYQKTGDLAAALVAAKKARELAARFDASNLSFYDQRIARVLRKQAAAK